MEETNAKKPEVIIEVKDARKIYKVGQERVTALDGVSFTINKGEFCCLLGTSGSRKINFTKYYGWNRENYIW